MIAECRSSGSDASRPSAAEPAFSSEAALRACWFMRCKIMASWSPKRFSSTWAAFRAAWRKSMDHLLRRMIQLAELSPQPSSVMRRSTFGSSSALQAPPGERQGSRQFRGAATAALRVHTAPLSHSSRTPPPGAPSAPSLRTRARKGPPSGNSSSSSSPSARPETAPNWLAAAFTRPPGDWRSHTDASARASSGTQESSHSPERSKLSEAPQTGAGSAASRSLALPVDSLSCAYW
mmetsp:Transcript_82733/g.256967  ORF Transcript_82733/g.256967 Transcript_82733/m.256967 type:complete len:235 (+) Transcript_82733:315-1019(+)